MPRYRHIPGLTPHPTRDPNGHSFGASHGQDATLPDLNRSQPLLSRDFLYGIDLFNEGYWWECHEVLEPLWLIAGRGSPAGHSLQAVILCAAAHLKVLMGNNHGARLLFENAENHVSEAAGFDLGLDLIGLLAETGACVTGDTHKPARLLLKSRLGR